MSQPFGILLEILLIKPLTENLPRPWKKGARRAFLWMWIIWTGRWYGDQYLKYGQFTEKELKLSPVELVMKAWQLRPALALRSVRGLSGLLLRVDSGYSSFRF